MFVEDNAMVRSVAYKGLDVMFDRVYVANDGVEALDILKEHNVDFVITDLNMPNMDGVALIKEIRRVCKMMPIIITTAYIEFGAVYEDIPNIYTITKPYSIFDIVIAIEELEDRYRAMRCPYEMLEDATAEARKVMDLLKKG